MTATPPAAEVAATLAAPRNRAALAARLRECASVAATQRHMRCYRLQCLAEAAQWLDAPLERRDDGGIRMVLSEAKAYRRMERRTRHAVLA